MFNAMNYCELTTLYFTYNHLLSAFQPLTKGNNILFAVRDLKQLHISQCM